MYTVYLLKSLVDDKIYVGVTEKNPEDRLRDHNSGSNAWTRMHRPLKLIYYETYYCKKDALHREKFLKSGVGNRVVKALRNEFK